MMADQNDVELHIEIVRARNDWSREKRHREVREQVAEINEQRAALRRCDASLIRELERLMQELPREEPAQEAMPRAVTQGPRQAPLPAHLRPKEQAAG
jgi:hypothetical protein